MKERKEGRKKEEMEEVSGSLLASHPLLLPQVWTIRAIHTPA